MEGEEEKTRENNMPNDGCPASLVYDPTFKQDPLPHYCPEEKLAMDPDYYPCNYVLEEDNNAPSLVINLVPPPVREQEKNSERSNKEEENKELEDPQDTDNRHAEEDSEWEVDKEDDYSEYSDSDSIS